MRWQFCGWFGSTIMSLAISTGSTLLRRTPNT